jgi:hypothetical protein
VDDEVVHHVGVDVDDPYVQVPGRRLEYGRLKHEAPEIHLQTGGIGCRGVGTAEERH